MKSKAFTLVELMVVIVVIGILAGLLLPAVNKVRENGRQAQCANNLKELQTAVITYAGNGGRFPYATIYQAYNTNLKQWEERRGWVGRRVGTFSPNVAGQCDMWDLGAVNGTACITNGTLYSYVLDKRVYLCPTFLIEAKKIQPTYNFVRSYVMNWELNYQNLYSLTDGSKKMLFTELNVKTNPDGPTISTYSVLSAGTPAINPAPSATTLIYGPQQTDGALYSPATRPATPPEAIAAYHNGKGHVVFADGHIEFLYHSNTWDTATGNW